MSIYNKIRIIFLVSFLFLSAFFASYFYIQKSQHIHNIEKRYAQTALFLHRHFRQSMREGEKVDFSDGTVKMYLHESDFRRISSIKKRSNILKDAHLVKKRKILHANFEILRVKNRFYLWLKHPKFELLLRDTQEQTPPWRLFLAYLFSLFFLVGLYLWLTKSLQPLKTLQNKIHKVAHGDLSVSFSSEKNDEIAQVSNAFDDALRKLESLIDSRQLFLRTIMHELKTPIGKGKILTSFVEDKKLQDGYEGVFERLELLLNEFAKIEQMLSANYVLKVANYNAKDLVEQALELMIMDDETLEKHVHIVEKSPLLLSTDFTLFPLALKNLIDNAIKYAPDNQVEILINKEGITIANRGKQFTNDVKTYFQPFHGKGKGLGLGLYIVYNIMAMLKMEFTYSYEENKNMFFIKKAHS